MIHVTMPGVQVADKSTSVFAPKGQPGQMRVFDSGATRNVDDNKPDPEGFLSPLVLDGYSDYMQTHRVQADGSLRASDNWQKGIPISAYQKSLIRHVKVAWRIWRGHGAKPEQVGLAMVVPTLKDALYAILFNVMGYLHELEKAEAEMKRKQADVPTSGGTQISQETVNEALEKFRNLRDKKEQERAEKSWPGILPGPSVRPLRYGGPQIENPGSL